MIDIGIKILETIQGEVEPQPHEYKGQSDFELKYPAEDEIRMGLYASTLEVHKKGRVINRFLTSLPRIYDPFSYSGRFTLIPICPGAKETNLIVLNTVDLSTQEIPVSFLDFNQFSICDERLIIKGYSDFKLYGCEKNELEEIEIPYNVKEIVFAHWQSSETIRILVSPENEDCQYILDYNTSSKQHTRNNIPSPSEVFGFSAEDYKELLNSDKFCLFSIEGYRSACVGYLLNRWILTEYNKSNNSYTLKTQIPVSNIYQNSSWDVKGVDTIEQTVELSFNGSETSGLEIYHRRLEALKRHNENSEKASWWSSVKNWIKA